MSADRACRVRLVVRRGRRQVAALTVWLAANRPRIRTLRVRQGRVTVSARAAGAAGEVRRSVIIRRT